MQRFTNRTAIVTGAGSGIGRAIAVRLASEGASVGVLDVDESGGRETATLITDEGGKSLYEACNVTDTGSIASAFDSVEDHFGPVSVAVNNAGIASVGTVASTSIEEFDRIFAVNVRGVFLCLREEVERMRKNGGAIVNLGSVAGDVAIPDRFAYSSAKGAVHMMTRSVACDCIEDGIRCNAVAPARVHTPFVDGYLKENYPGKEQEMFDKLSDAQPLGRMGKPEEIAALTAYLCSEEAAFITGSIVQIDGGFTNLRL